MALETRQPSRDRWRVEMVEQRTEGGIVLFEYAIREPGRNPFLLNNHRAQLREQHHRIITGPKGGMMHVSGIEVLPEDLEEFEASSPEFYRWVDKDRFGRWRDDRGRVLPPFMFPAAPWAGGRMEELDPQWQRETFTLPLAGQVQECIDRYQDRAERLAWVGDRRGTTLNLQVGASSDDADQASNDTVSTTNSFITIEAIDQHFGARFVNLSIPPGATINNAIYSVHIFSFRVDEPKHQVRGQAADNPGTFTTATNDIDGRTRTTASVQWNSTNLGSSGGFEQWGCTTSGGAGASIASIIQEIVNRSGWASGNALVLIFEQHTSTDASRDLGVSAYDSGSANAPKLDIDYTAGGAPKAPPPNLRNYRRHRWISRRMYR